MQTSAITPVRRVTKEHPLSWFQERMWLLNRKNPDDLSYNIPVVFYLEGSLSVDALNKSINDILRRHETLRTRFSTTAGGESVQVIPASPFLYRFSKPRKVISPVISMRMHAMFSTSNRDLFSRDGFLLSVKTVTSCF